MRNAFSLFILFFIPLIITAQIENLIFGQDDSSALLSSPETNYSYHFLTPGDTIFLSLDYFGQKSFQHDVREGQTLFAISRFYGLSVEELYFFNPGLKDGVVHLGQKIIIPIPNRAILRYRPARFDSSRYAPIFYMVKRGDTMFNICKRQFRMPIDTIVKRNNLTDIHLRPGQLIHLGWMNINGIPESFHQANLDPIARRNAAMREIFHRTNAEKEMLEHKGAAVWKKDSKEDSDFYALHRFAPLNAVIEVENPMTKRIVYVKVIGKIPDRAYDDEVVIVLSPLSAKALGAKDPRFFVRVSYPN